MINYETILSLFDDKLTLLEYLTKIEQALKNEKLTNITVTQTDASHVYFTFVFEDGSTIDTPTFTLPKGDTGATGATGADGVSVVDADIDASGHLILTLSNGNTIDAGATGLQTVTADDIDSGETTQYEVLKADGDGGATWGRVTADDIADNSQVGQVLGSTGYGFAGWRKFEISSGQVNSSGGTQGQVLTADGSGGASWETPSSSKKYITITGASGTLSDDDFNTILNSNTPIYASDLHRIYYKIDEDYAMLYYVAYYQSSHSFKQQLLNIGKGSKQWQFYNNNVEVNTNNFHSGSATAGQVLTANGSGGTSWQSASSGNKKYLHQIQANSSNFQLTCNFVDTSSSAINNFNSLRTALSAAAPNYIQINANGVFFENAKNYSIYAITADGSTIYLYVADLTATSLTTAYKYVYSLSSVSDNVTEL